MNLKKLLSTGYFPKELPPPFNTEMFGRKSAQILRRWNKVLSAKATRIGTESAKEAENRFYQDYTFKYGSSSDISFSFAKGILTRRQLSIPNPKQFIDLSKNITENWKELKNALGNSNFSASSPVEAGAFRSVRTKSRSLNDFKFQLINISENKKYELKLDINQFYPSIYTHSLAWAILGKDVAVKYFKLKNRNKNKTHWSNLLKTDKLAKLYSFADLLDTLVRNCQDRQSIGIPIGPDTSFILAEIVGNRIDKEIVAKFKTIDYSFTRYYDDYYFYTNNYGDAEKISKETQAILNRFNLELNESKVNIKTLPFSFEPTWVSTLSSFYFSREVNKHELLSFFTIVFKLVEENRKDSSWIISHAMGRFEYGNVRIPEDSWDIFLTLLIKTMLTDASNIDKFLKIILSYERRLSKKYEVKVSRLLHEIIEVNIFLNHSFEVSWALWTLVSLKIKCNSALLAKVINSDDQVSKLICLDIISKRLCQGQKPSVKSIADNLNESDMFNEKWLVTYESIRKGWIAAPIDFVNGNEFFKILFDLDVSFYNQLNQVSPEFKEDEYRFRPTDDGSIFK